METEITTKKELDHVFTVRDVSVSYGDFTAVKNVSMDMFKNNITAFIGPSGCGKSTLIRSFNRMNDLIPNAVVNGEINYQGINLYDEEVDPVQVRRRIGIVEKALIQAALWDEVKNDLDKNALDLSGGQQQRLCIARTIAVEPDTILMDEPCSALDPVATKKIEDLMQILVKDFSILIVTHNMQQASRVSNYCAFFTTKATDDGRRTGELVEYSDTKTMFTNPSESLTEEYISGRFG